MCGESFRQYKYCQIETVARPVVVVCTRRACLPCLASSLRSPQVCGRRERRRRVARAPRLQGPRRLACSCVHIHGFACVRSCSASARPAAREHRRGRPPCTLHARVHRAQLIGPRRVPAPLRPPARPLTCTRRQLRPSRIVKACTVKRGGRWRVYATARACPGIRRRGARFAAGFEATPPPIGREPTPPPIGREPMPPPIGREPMPPPIAPR